MVARPQGAGRRGEHGRAADAGCVGQHVVPLLQGAKIEVGGRDRCSERAPAERDREQVVQRGAVDAQERAQMDQPTTKREKILDR